ncbi:MULTISPECIES: hypothetical protein [unclassified Oceanobacter]|uniref:hypothetical protein n=1 Tax=unclassified Oceanobacter TaxID=2620260 RepID=UPI0026E43BA0|nr:MULTISPECIES: hypothetical protein [unclassified Oceanobacter]MDO6681273.1 hypothetical protein [Oceanobacter sp. 5_MG-2023]MDP2505208.1 hypothetical protein [Oceanobacter sp. 3_MG-2023]MDP2549193.1 hypothetical protein [Oceanobacter sp. 4_MG-2023]
MEVGTSLAMVGTSGSDKPTLLGIMAGLGFPSVGELSLLGHRGIFQHGCPVNY